MASSTKVCTTTNLTLLSGTSPTRVTLGNSTNMAISDNVYFSAACTGAGTNTFTMRAGGFGFSIPTTATIDGYEILIERSRGNTGVGNCVDTTIQINATGTNKATNSSFPTTDTNIIYGSPTDKWGLNYTPTDVNTNFIVATVTNISVTSGTVEARFDFIQATIYYTEAITGKKRSVSGGVSYFASAAHF